MLAKKRKDLNKRKDMMTAEEVGERCVKMLEGWRTRQDMMTAEKVEKLQQKRGTITKKVKV